MEILRTQTDDLHRDEGADENARRGGLAGHSKDLFSGLPESVVGAGKYKNNIYI